MFSLQLEKEVLSRGPPVWRNSFFQKLVLHAIVKRSLGRVRSQRSSRHPRRTASGLRQGPSHFAPDAPAPARYGGIRYLSGSRQAGSPRRRRVARGSEQNPCRRGQRAIVVPRMKVKGLSQETARSSGPALRVREAQPYGAHGSVRGDPRMIPPCLFRWRQRGSSRFPVCRIPRKVRSHLRQRAFSKLNVSMADLSFEFPECSQLGLESDLALDYS